jgi:hypothetical protein
VKNAIQAMDGKGTLEVSVGRLMRLNYPFTDTGWALPENIGKIFSPLAPRLGLGFGLSITKMIIDKHRVRYNNRNQEKGHDPHPSLSIIILRRNRPCSKVKDTRC